MAKLYFTVDRDARKRIRHTAHRKVSIRLDTWNLGIMVEATVLEDGKVHFEIFETKGSEGIGLQEVYVVKGE